MCSSASTGPTRQRSRQHRGAGLGLSIVAAIVTVHGGRVSASACPGGGAALMVRLPADVVPVAAEPLW
jgi:two-component system OmpR family sensor kinase